MPTTSADVSEAARKTMRSNRGKDTRPELAVRRLAHAMGFRYRLHRRDLPGTPDLVFPSRRAIIEVRGCFWHRHQGCGRASLPKTRSEFWSAKFEANVSRDRRNLEQLEGDGWRVLVIWECEIGREPLLKDRMRRFLDG